MDDYPCADLFLYDRRTGANEFVSRSSTGELGDAESWGAAISADNRFVAFISTSSNFVPDSGGACDSSLMYNGCPQVFLRDRELGTTTLVSATPEGKPSNGQSYSVAISSDARSVVFSSVASDLVVGDTEQCGHPADYEAVGCMDVFIRDMTLRSTTRVSLATDGTEANGDSLSPSISADGRLVAFSSADPDLEKGLTPSQRPGPAVYLHDRSTGETRRIPHEELTGEVTASRPEISADGRYISFKAQIWTRDARGTVSQGEEKIYRYDVERGEFDQVTVPATGDRLDGDEVYNGRISADGRWIVFGSSATNLVEGFHGCSTCVHLFARDMVRRQTVWLTAGDEFRRDGSTGWAWGISAIRPTVVFGWTDGSSSSAHPGSLPGIHLYDLTSRELRPLSS